MVNQLPVNDDQESAYGERKDAIEREVNFGRVFCGALLSIRHFKKKKKFHSKEQKTFLCYIGLISFD